MASKILCDDLFSPQMYLKVAAVYIAFPIQATTLSHVVWLHASLPVIWMETAPVR